MELTTKILPPYERCTDKALPMGYFNLPSLTALDDFAVTAGSNSFDATDTRDAGDADEHANYLYL